MAQINRVHGGERQLESLLECHPESWVSGARRRSRAAELRREAGQEAARGPMGACQHWCREMKESRARKGICGTSLHVNWFPKVESVGRWQRFGEKPSNCLHLPTPKAAQPRGCDVSETGKDQNKNQRKAIKTKDRYEFTSQEKICLV